MSFEPPDDTDFSTDVSFPTQKANFIRNNNNTSRYQSPLLQTPSFVKDTQRNKFPNSFKPNSSASYNPQYNNRSQFNTVHDRVGQRPAPYNRESNTINQNNPDRNANVDNRNFNNRKRNHDASSSANIPRKQWKGKRPPFYQKSNNNEYNINMAQNRMNRIRSNPQLNEIKPETTLFVEPTLRDPEPEINDSQELDATDITVQVINHNAAAPKEEASLCRFKMSLDPKTQANIRILQQKRKDKQVIIPSPVTPNVTGISLHDRFAML